jgi:hypothetical protein
MRKGPMGSGKRPLFIDKWPLLLGRGPLPPGRRPFLRDRGSWPTGIGPFLPGRGPCPDSRGPFSCRRRTFDKGQRTSSLMAKGPGSLSKGFFVKTKGLFPKTKGLFPKTKGLSLESKALRLESKRLFVESERISRDRTVHSKRTPDRSVVKLVAPISLSAQGALSFDGRTLRIAVGPSPQRLSGPDEARIFDRVKLVEQDGRGGSRTPRRFGDADHDSLHRPRRRRSPSRRRSRR